MILDKLLQITSSLIVGIVLSRYLGVELFGYLNYIVGIAAIFWAFSKFGLDNVVIDELVKANNKSAVISSAFLLKLLFSILVTICAYFISKTFISDETGVILIVLITAGSVFQSVEVVDFLNQSINKNVYSVFARISTLTLLIVLRLAGVYLEFDVSFFVYTYFFEKVILCFFYLLFQNKTTSNLYKLTFDRVVIKRLFIRSLPLTFSSLMVILYMKIDMFMLESYYGPSSVGVYSVATRIIDIVYIIPALVMTVMMPKLIMYNSNLDDNFDSTYSRLFRAANFFSILSIVFVYFFGDYTVTLVFGDEYHESASILLVLMLSSIFGMSGIMSSRWFVIKELQNYTLARTFVGLIVNVLLNYALIPAWGPMGAAFSTLVSQIIACYLFNLFSFKCRPLFILQTKSFLFLK
ncbi:Capsular polysaccharide biosynthesis protein CapF [Vibrio scophthalmi]|uniref:Capsular polysaccharide biosynthesis protein CapF n=2 Tax=Vibrio scophthalmi TaxID=45658 RepID=A0A1C7FD81_9VIBR|nr:Capsular polysaccharide biosynthesis protein CapF [Vibrio scophthalmi]